MNAACSADILALIAGKAEGFKEMAENFAKSRFLLASIEYGQNEEEMSALERIAEGIKCEIEQSGSSVSLSIDYDEEDDGSYLEIIQEGMPAPYAGGDGGIVKNPDGTFSDSNVNPSLWGTRLDMYAKQGSDTLEEVNRMLTDLFTAEVQGIVAASHSEIAGIAKRYIVQELRSALPK